MTYKILDCTLRDGGYYNKWNFSLNFVKKYNSVIKKTKIDIVEIGFRKKNELKESKQLFLYTSDNTLQKIKFSKNQLVAVMIDLTDYRSLKDLEYLNTSFPDKKNSKISIIRIACNYEDKILLKPVVQILKNKKYIVAANLMKFTNLNEFKIIEFFSYAEKLKVDYFYLADSLGNCKPNNLKKLSNKIKKELKIEKFGFHSHNNLGLALSNSLTAVKLGFGIIDTSINGMGRGAGNLKLESLLEHQKKNKQAIIIKKFIKKNFLNLKKKYNWGTNKFYKQSAKYNIHPTYIQRLLAEKKYKKNIIKNIIKYLIKTKASSYDANIFETLFLKNNPIINKYQIKGDNILLIGAKTLTKNENKILINKDYNNYLFATLNYNPEINKKFIDYIFICNPFRLITENKIIKNTKIITPNIIGIWDKNNKNKIFYNISKSQNILINKKQCSFTKNLVLFYSLSFCIANNFKKILILGLSKNFINQFIINEVKKYVKKRSFNTIIKVKFSK